MYRTVLGALSILSVSGAQAATLSLKAVKINDSPIAPTSDVTVLPGDKIECEAWVEGWADQFPGGLTICEFAFDPLGYLSGTSGAMRPIHHDRPLRMFNLCQDGGDCIPGFSCSLVPGRFNVEPVCRPPSCADLCLPDDVCYYSGWCAIDSHIAPGNGSPAVGVFVDFDRPDFLFAGRHPLGLVVLFTAPSYRIGTGSEFGEVLSPGERQNGYVGSLIVRASSAGSDDGEACGSFKLGFRVDNYQTYMDGPGVPLPAPPPSNLNPLTVHVDCDALGACCDCFAGTCQSHVRPSDCLGSAKSFRPGEECAPSGACPSCAIPTVSEWGLVTLTLLLFVGAKLWSGRQDRSDSSPTA